MKDPSTSESYIALRNALLAMREDASAVQSVLSATSDGGKAWIETAYCELRRSLVQGRLKQAETLGSLIGLILTLRDPDKDDELSESRLHKDAMKALGNGIGAILRQDNLTGISHLEGLTEAVYSAESLRWVAWYWIANAAEDEGDLELAKGAVEQAMSLTAGLDAQARASTLCRLGEIEFKRQEADSALEHLNEASETFRNLGDRRGMATASLGLGKMLAELGREEAALDAAQRAQDADSDWEEPALFLSRRALMDGAAEQAETYLAPFADLEPRSPEVDRQRRLIQLLREDRVPASVLADYLRLREQPASPETVVRLEQLSKEHETFLQLRELLAWSLVKVGREDEAAAHFRAMATVKLDPEVQSSVLLGLGCLANRQFRHRQPGARVRAAAAAFDAPKETPAGPPPPDVVYEGVDEEAEVEYELVEEGDADDIVLTLDEEVPSNEFDASPATRPVEDLQQTLGDGVDFGAVADDAVEQLGSLQMEAEPAQRERRNTAVQQPAEGGGRTASAAVFTGDLQLFAVPDLLDFLNSSRRTGTLVITSEHGIGAVHLKDGSIAGAAAPGSPSMGNILVEQGKLTPEQIDSAVADQKVNHPESLLGAILLDMGLVEQQVLKEALERQVRSSLREMVDWTQGRFAFEPDRDAPTLPGQIELSIDTRSMLLDVLREYDEENK